MPGQTVIWANIASCTQRSINAGFMTKCFTDGEISLMKFNFRFQIWANNQPEIEGIVAMHWADNKSMGTVSYLDLRSIHEYAEDLNICELIATRQNPPLPTPIQTPVPTPTLQPTDFILSIIPGVNPTQDIITVSGLSAPTTIWVTYNAQTGLQPVCPITVPYLPLTAPISLVYDIQLPTGTIIQAFSADCQQKSNLVLWISR